MGTRGGGTAFNSLPDRVTRYSRVKKKSPASAMSLGRVLRRPGRRDVRGRYGGGRDVFRGGNAKCIVGNGRPGERSLGLG